MDRSSSLQSRERFRKFRALLVVIALAGLVLSCSSSDERFVQHVQKGRQSLEAGELKKAEIEIDRKILADLAIADPQGFSAVVKTAMA